MPLDDKVGARGKQDVVSRPAAHSLHSRLSGRRSIMMQTASLIDLSAAIAHFAHHKRTLFPI